MWGNSWMDVCRKGLQRWFIIKRVCMAVMLNVMNTFLCVPVNEQSLFAAFSIPITFFMCCVSLGLPLAIMIDRIQIFMTTEGCPRQTHLLEANGIWTAY